MLWLLACTADLSADLLPTRWTPAASQIAWTGPAGHATLTADPGWFGGERVVAEADVDQGSSTLPLTLLPPGSWRWKLEVVRGDRKWRADGHLDVPDPPAGAGDPHRTSVDRGDSQLDAGGYWVGYHFGYRWDLWDAIPLVLDGNGDVVWWVPPDPDGGLAMRVKPSHDRRSVLVLQDFEDGARRELHRYALDGTERVETAVPDASHDFWENDDGTITYVAYAYSDTELVPGQRGPAVADVLRTVAEGAADDAEAEDGWDYFADYPLDPWYPCDHADWDTFVPDAAEWSHTSSLMKSPIDGGWVLQSRYFDAVLEVDGHELLWQAGGVGATLTPTDPGAAVHHAHSSDLWAGDDGKLHLLAFDNGNHLPTPIVSRVVELAIDPDGGTVDPVWELRDPDGLLTGFLGDAQRLPNGNTLIGWTARGELAEYTPGGDEVWSSQATGSLGRGYWVPSLTP